MRDNNKSDNCELLLMNDIMNTYRVLQRTAISTNIKVRSMTLQGSILAYHGLKTKTSLLHGIASTMWENLAVDSYFLIRQL